MSARDELAKLLAEAKYGADFDFEGRDNRSPAKYFTTKQADAILAAGYTKPRTVTTEDELDGLPKGSVILSHLGGVWTKYYDHYLEGDNWEAKGSSHIHLDDLPATVLHEPTA